jgi:hypothetical protein
MRELLETVRGKVFVHPVTKEPYGRIRIPRAVEKPKSLEGKLYDVLAEDEGGNYFTVAEDGAVWFWDHETDDLLHLSGSIAEFVAHCIDPPPVELDLKRVKSVWIDPAFAKSIGKKVPPDGWIKKPSKPK